MGGVVPLGYRIEKRKLLVDEPEGRTVRLIFERYLAVGSLPALQRDLRERGIVSRTRTLSSGRVVGGVALTNGPLAHLLRNRVYLGEINHHGKSHPGEHEPIIPTDLFDAVQAKLAGNLTARRHPYSQSEALLIGRLFDDRGNHLTPSYAVKNGLRYRYYVSSVLAQGRHEEAGSVARVAASDIEATVIAGLRALDSDRDSTDRDLIQRSLERVTIHKDQIEIVRVGDDQNPIRSDWSPAAFRRKRELIVPAGGEPDRSTRPMKAEDRARILKGIARGRSWLQELTSGSVANPDAIAVREGCSERAIRLTLSLAFLSPAIIQAIVAGRLPRGIGIKHLASLPSRWSEQHATLGL